MSYFIFQDTFNGRLLEHLGIVYHLDEGEKDSVFTVRTFGPVTKFKVANNYIGVENKAQQTPILIKIARLIHIFWLDCDSFSFVNDCHYIYYNVNQSIFQYDLRKSRTDRFEVTRKIAIDVISNRFSLTTINDRFLLVRSIIPYSFEIFDVKEHVPVRTIQLAQGYRLCHVGKLSVSFANKRKIIVVRFC